MIALDPVSWPDDDRPTEVSTLTIKVMSTLHPILRYYCCVLCFMLAWWAASPTLVAQQTSPADGSGVKPASFVRSSDNHLERQSVRFGRHPARIGDRVEQEIQLAMRLATSLRQGNQIVEKKQTAMRSTQHRIVITTEVSAGRATSVVVEYVKATNQMSVGEPLTSTNTNFSAVDSAPTTEQPVHGKTYHCRREGDEDGKLLITDRAGNVPPKEECEIVSQNMEMIGRANPLVEFLAGRTIALGETLNLPQEAADRLFNLGDRFGAVNRFELTLRKTLVDGGTTCAEFWARVDAASSDSSQMRLQVEGPLVVQIDGCRAVRSELSGPIGLAESRGSYGTISYLMGTGQLSVRINSVYASTKR
jgi:hypothetical protein